jgi:hypothetical protein
VGCRLHGAYTVAAIVCARRLGDVAVLGIAMLPLSIGAITVVALAATGAIAVAAYRRRPAGGPRRHRPREASCTPWR